MPVSAPPRTFANGLCENGKGLARTEFSDRGLEIRDKSQFTRPRLCRGAPTEGIFDAVGSEVVGHAIAKADPVFQIVFAGAQSLHKSWGARRPQPAQSARRVPQKQSCPRGDFPAFLFTCLFLFFRGSPFAHSYLSPKGRIPRCTTRGAVCLFCCGGLSVRGARQKRGFTVCLRCNPRSPTNFEGSRCHRLLVEPW